MTFAPSGQRARSGVATSVILKVDGGIRKYSVGECEVLQPYPADELCDGMHVHG
jgi:hypothetical protein